MPLRRLMRERRQALTTTELAAAAAGLAAVIARSFPELRSARRVGLYAAIRGELAVDLVDCGAAQPFLPAVVPGGLLVFGGADGPRRSGVFAISEPLDASTPIGELDIVLVPGLAFDRQGNRLGWGAGHYDRSFAPVRYDPVPVRVGIAYEFQLVDALDTEPWDVPMHAVATPERFIDLRSNSC